VCCNAEKAQENVSEDKKSGRLSQLEIGADIVLQVIESDI
jgi:hypothetical protein